MVKCEIAPQFLGDAEKSVHFAAELEALANLVVGLGLVRGVVLGYFYYPVGGDYASFYGYCVEWEFLFSRFGGFEGFHGRISQIRFGVCSVRGFTVCDLYAS